ncbi:MAG: ROK family protein [Blastocatellia bacterium]|nr:ROK family protein [Blastocatellia bacterium]HMZ82165.1 ROK family protein [Acidobacteriota bacterium]
MLFLGADIGRTTRFALVDETGRLHQQSRVPTDIRSGRAFVNGLIAAFREAIEKASAPVGAAGIGLPGLVDHHTQQIEVLTNFLNISAIDLHGECERALGIPVIFDNDANLAAFAEWQCGAAQGATDAVLITLGRGIGCGLILKGELQRGARGFAGEFGHTKIGNEPIECSCGASGCLETVVSGPNIVRRTRELLFLDPRFTHSTLVSKMRIKLTCEDVVDAAKFGDELARTVLEDTARSLGIAISNIINLLNVEKVVLGGPVMGAGDFLLASIREEVARNAFAPLLVRCSIVTGTLGNDAGMIGAGLLAKRELEQAPPK